MGTTLTGTTPQDTYDSLIKVTDNGPLSGTAKYLSDGLGNDSTLALSTARVGIGTNTPASDKALQINNGSGAFVRVTLTNTATGTAGTDGLSISVENSKAIIKNQENEDLVLGANNSETQLVLVASGNVGIGTSAPTAGYKLDLRGRAITYNSGYIADFVSTDPNASTIQLYADDGNVSIVQGGTSVVPLTFFVGGTEKMRIQAGGGISFNGDTAAANALDDYEEGTFTATLTPSTSGTITLSVNTCTYTKIGRQVSVKGFLTISSVSLPVGDSVDIGGLPFTIINSASGRGTFSFVVLDASVGYTAFTGPTQHTANSTSLIAYYNAATLEASDEIMFTATYFV
jgi:hypothetical protein